MLHKALLPGWSGISLGEPSEGVRTLRAGVFPLYPDPWADSRILLPSLCCSKPPPRLLLSCTGCTKHHLHPCSNLQPPSPFL